MEKIRMIDVAKKAGVSKSTVSQYLNKRYEFMSKDTRQRISEVIQELGFKPNSVARSLKLKKTNTIGIIVPNINYSFSTAVSRGVEDYCQKKGYSVIICNSDDNPEKEHAYIQMLQMKQVDGIIISSTGENNALLKDEIIRQLPLVLLDRIFEDIEIDMVSSDHRSGAFEAIMHLIKMGHKRILVVIPDEHLNSSRVSRIKGYYDALVEYNIVADEDLIVYVSENNIDAKMDDLFKMDDPPTAVFCINDLATLQVLTYLKREKVKIPEDVAVIGVDDFPAANLLESPLTVVGQHTYDMGIKAAELLIRRIEEKNVDKCVQHIFPCELIVRESCGFKNE
ncbi:MAG: LacI family transcriptional regulator [Firmicutes bacterium HGW-Firmicutes-5]|nr:MAG: LacI family transcriptional regulator [Firmicutes bacterium HGW-Firmicutes-5]